MESEKIDVLVIEDDQPQAELIKEMLEAQQRQRYAVRHVHYLAHGLEALREKRFDCVLVDLGLPDSQGLDSALSVRRQTKEVPIVVLTVLDDEAAALTALKMDIQDYLIKGDINAALLTRSIRYALQRKAVAEELAQSEERLRLASEAAEVGMWHWDLVQDELHLDARCKAMFGFAADSRPGYDEIVDSIHPVDRQRVEQGVRRALEEGAEYAVEIRVPLPDGTLRWLISKGRVHLDEQGKPLRIDGMNIDISQRKQWEEALFHAKEEWEMTFDAVPDLIAILGTDNRIVRINSRMSEQLGKKPEELIGQPCHVAFHGTDTPPQSCPHVKAVTECRQQIAEVEEPDSDAWYLVSYNPLAEPDGTPVGFVRVARDITEQKLAEKRIELLNAELEKRAADLEAANKELEAFNYTVAHDLRQPLNVVYGYCQTIEMLCGRMITEDCRGYLQDVYNGVRRMTRLLDSLLDFSRMSRVELRRTSVDLSSMARGIAKGLKETEPQRTASFRIAEDIEADGDPGLLELVLQNLIGNAWKYTVAVREAVIEFGATETTGKRVYFVRDNGQGFEMAVADTLFAPFVRLPGAETSRGFGIGLATVARIVARHGGKVWAEGEPGKGATFYFTLN